MNKSVNVIKTISYLVGGVVIAVIGFLFIAITDLYLRSTSTLLFISVFLSIGSGIFFLLSESFRNKKTIYFVLKGVAIALSILFIIFLFGMANQDPDKIQELATKEKLNLFEKIRSSMYNVFNTKAYYKLFKYSPDKGRNIFFLAKGFNSAQSIEFSYAPLHTTIIVLSIVATVLQIFNTGFNAYLGVEE